MLNFITKTLSKVFGTKSDKDIKEIMPYVERSKEIYAGLSSLSNDQLRGKTQEFKDKIAQHLKDIDDQIAAIKKAVNEDADMDPIQKEDEYAKVDVLIKKRDDQLEEVLLEILPEAFAVVRETARRFTENPTLTAKATDLDRDLAVGKDHIVIEGDQVTYANTWNAAGSPITWNMVHYDVQLIGGTVMHMGKIAEMATGEGKTLVATLPMYLNGLSGQGVHLVTVNDYLARRDSEWMGPIFNFLGLTIDCIDKYPPHTEERHKAYLADITYGTNNEFGFDYLRDNMSRNMDELVQRKHHFAIIDEVDSVLIDDARTPLIISGPVPRGDQHEFHDLKPRIQRLVEAQRKVVNGFLTDAKRQIEAGKTGDQDGGLALLRAHRGLPKLKPLIKYLSETGNKQVLQKTENHYMQDNNRDMPKADAELYFVIEEKHNSVELTERGIELITASGEEKDFFVMPDVGGEIAIIEKSDLPAEEKLKQKDQLMRDFAVKSERLHSVQQLLKAYALFEKDVEYVVMDGKVKIVDENTGRIMDGRRYSDGLHQAIEAKENVKVEAATQTFASVTLQNYFRMYHKLSGMTGTAETEAGEFWEIYKLDVVSIPTNRPIQRDDREDLVFRTTREKYKAIVDEILDLSAKGRPVLVGTTSVEVSELISKVLTRQKLKHNVLNAKQHQREADIVAEAGMPGAITIATNMAGRGTDIKLGEGVKEAGGLAIIGTERHDSRRVDRQLRGRAGRQGDPGSSQFFVSLEDSLMRMFGSDRIAGLMDRMGYEEGEVIQHSMITKSIERAQKKVEENNFGIRKRLLEYDDVMNAQREVVYKRRYNGLNGDRLSIDINNMFYELVEELIGMHAGSQEHDEFKLDVIRYFSVDTAITAAELEAGKTNKLVDQLYHEVRDMYKRKTDAMREGLLPGIEKIHHDVNASFSKVRMPFSDGQKVIDVRADIEECVNSKGREIVASLEKFVTLGIIDEAWKEHLRQMDELRQSVQSAVYEQKDPLLVYKLEAYNLFKEMVGEMNREIASFLCKARLVVEQEAPIRAAEATQRTDMSKMQTTRNDQNPLLGQQAGGGAPQQQPEQAKSEPVRVEEKIGRNEPCPCGSGKKYKNCHGQE